MATFPPKNASKSAPVIAAVETPAVSTGGGGIPASLKIKAAGNKTAPGAGPQKTVQEF